MKKILLIAVATATFFSMPIAVGAKNERIVEPIPPREVEIVYVVKGDSDTSTSLEIPIIEETEYEFTAEEIDLLARVVMSESSIEPYECKVGVAKTVINRVMSDNYPNTVAEVVNEPFQFSTADNGTPDSECYKAVHNAIDYPDCFPNDMVYFRTDYYHDYGFPYVKIGKTCFSTTLNYNN